MAAVATAAAACALVSAAFVIATASAIELAAFLYVTAVAHRNPAWAATDFLDLAYNAGSWMDDVSWSCYYFPLPWAVCTAGQHILAVVPLCVRRCRRLWRQMATVWLVACQRRRWPFQARRPLVVVWACVRRY